MDKSKLIAQIAAKHNVRLDPDDPAFILVALNEMVLKERLDQVPSSEESMRSFKWFVIAVLIFLIGLCAATGLSGYKMGKRAGYNEALIEAMGKSETTEMSAKTGKEKTRRKVKNGGRL